MFYGRGGGGYMYTHVRCQLGGDSDMDATEMLNLLWQHGATLKATLLPLFFFRDLELGVVNTARPECDI